MWHQIPCTGLASTTLEVCYLQKVVTIHWNLPTPLRLNPQEDFLQVPSCSLMPKPPLLTIVGLPKQKMVSQKNPKPTTEDLSHTSHRHPTCSSWTRPPSCTNMLTVLAGLHKTATPAARQRPQFLLQSHFGGVHTTESSLLSAVLTWKPQCFLKQPEVSLS